MSLADPGTPEELIRRLGDTVTGLNRLASETPAFEAWHRRAGDEWSAAEILAHVRASEDILLPRVYQILVRDNPPLPAFDERRWAEIAGYAAMPVDAHFARIVIRRYELIQLLRSLTPEAWQRTGVHEERGAVTLEQIVAHIVGHAEEHQHQMEKLLAAFG